MDNIFDIVYFTILANLNAKSSTKRYDARDRKDARENHLYNPYEKGVVMSNANRIAKRFHKSQAAKAWRKTGTDDEVGKKYFRKVYDLAWKMH